MGGTDAAALATRHIQGGLIGYIRVEWGRQLQVVHVESRVPPKSAVVLLGRLFDHRKYGRSRPRPALSTAGR